VRWGTLTGREALKNVSDEDRARLAHQYRPSIEAPEELINLRVRKET
jgi:hypothetical protein